MTNKFERGILFVVGGLVVGLLVLAVMNPPSSEITLPDAQLKASSPGNVLETSNETTPEALDGIFQIKAVGTAAESLSDDLEIRTLHSVHKATNLHTAADLSRTLLEPISNLSRTCPEPFPNLSRNLP